MVFPRTQFALRNEIALFRTLHLKISFSQFNLTFPSQLYMFHACFLALHPALRKPHILHLNTFERCMGQPKHAKIKRLSLYIDNPPSYLESKWKMIRWFAAYVLLKKQIILVRDVPSTIAHSHAIGIADMGSAQRNFTVNAANKQYLVYVLMMNSTSKLSAW